MKLEFNTTAQLVGQQILQTHRLNIAGLGWDSDMIFGKYFTAAYFPKYDNLHEKALKLQYF